MLPRPESPFVRFRLLAPTLLGIAAACGGGDEPAAPDTTVASVVVSPSTATLTALGATTTLSAQPRNAAGDALAGSTVTWSATDAGVATVSSSGVVTAVANGSTTIRAAVGSVSGTATVTVAQAPASIVVSPSVDTTVVGASVSLSAVVSDAQSAPVPGATVTWSSSAAGVASVTSAGVVTGVSAGTATITATSGTASGTSSVLVVPAPLVVTRDTTLSGNVNVGAVTIPAGVTVTVGNDLTLRATGAISIAGIIEADCRAIDIQGDTALTITGTVRNVCASPEDTAPLRLAGNGELTVENAVIESSGDITIANDPTLDDSDFLLAVTTLQRAEAAGPGVPFTRFRNSTVRYGPGGSTGPRPAKDGADGVNGGPARNGRTVRFFLDGNAEFAGGTLLWGQNGGKGGDGNDTKASDVTVTGGKGGDGGLIRIRVTGSLKYMGLSNTVRGGRGGDGGSATATATRNAALPVAPSATATGGAGGLAGVMDIRANGGIFIDPGALVVELGAGDGGDATATGAPGADALEAPNMPAQVGGKATATGGVGGATPDAQLVQQTSGDPIFDGIDFNIPHAGDGGTALATAGSGGKGMIPHKNGAAGGDIVATGGAGGVRGLRDAGGVPIDVSGDGGDAIFIGGNGGAGWNDCKPDSLQAGGNGGRGGNASGAPGARGAGAPSGVDGNRTFSNVGNGGRAGDGAGPGMAGAMGTNAVQALGTDSLAGRTFTVGDPGTDCSAPPPPPPQVELRINFLFAPGEVPVNTYVMELVVNDEVVGSIPIATSGTPNAQFWAQNPTRIGWASSGGWRFFVANAIVNGQPYAPTAIYLCILNTQFNLFDLEGVFAPRAAQMVYLQQRDALGELLGEVGINSNTCTETPLLNSAATFDLIGTGSGAFADATEFGLKHVPPLVPFD